MKAKLIKKDAPKPATRPKPKKRAKPVRPEPKPPVNPRAEFEALFTKK